MAGKVYYIIFSVVVNNCKEIHTYFEFNKFNFTIMKMTKYDIYM